MRTPSPQHAIDSDARTLMLRFSRQDQTLRVHSPPSGVAAPPGTYYVFINKRTQKGPIPSTAAVVIVGTEADDAPAYVYPDSGLPSGSATPTEDSSYLAKPPPLPHG